MVFRIISSDNVLTEPTPTSNGVQGWFNTAFPYTEFTPDFSNMLMDEVVNFATFAGQTPTVGINNQMLLALLNNFVRGRAQQYPGNLTTTQYYTFQAPANTYLVKVTCLGAGAGGGACQNSVNQYTSMGSSGGGGGAGGLVIAYVPVTPGQNYSIVAGGGGVGGTQNNPPGTAGQASSFNGVITAYGGIGAGDTDGFGHEGGAGGSTSVVTSGVATIVVQSPGGYGGDGNGASIQYGGGNGGNSLFGSGGRTGVNIGLTAQAYGSGGGGSYLLNNGTIAGNGAPGVVIVEY